MNIRLQQYLLTFRESRTFAGSSPALTLFEYSACLSAIRFPQVKHRTGINILEASSRKQYKNYGKKESPSLI